MSNTTQTAEQQLAAIAGPADTQAIRADWYMDDSDRIHARVKHPAFPWQGISVAALQAILLKDKDALVQAAVLASKGVNDPKVVERCRKERAIKHAKKASKGKAKPSTAAAAGDDLDAQLAALAAG